MKITYLLLLGSVAMIAPSHGRTVSENRRTVDVSTETDGSVTTTTTTTTDTTTSKTTTVGTPTGSLSVDKALIRKGGTPKLTWAVNYPILVIEDVVEITDVGVLISKAKLQVDVYMIGAAVSNNLDTSAAWMKLGGGPWKTVYKGKGLDIDSSTVMLSGVILDNMQNSLPVVLNIVTVQ